MSDSTHPIPILGAHLNVEFSFTHDGRARISKKSRFMGNSAGWNTQVCVQMFGHFPMAPSIHPSTSSRSDLDQESHSIYDSNAIRSKRWPFLENLIFFQVLEISHVDWIYWTKQNSEVIFEWGMIFSMWRSATIWEKGTSLGKPVFLPCIAILFKSQELCNPSKFGKHIQIRN